MRLPAAIVLVLFLNAAQAGDPPPAGDSISDAKKDLASIQTQGNAPESTSPIPQLELRDLGPAPGPPTPAPVLTEELANGPASDPGKKRAATGNWLVDAMEKNAAGTRPSREGSKADALRGDTELAAGAGKAEQPVDEAAGFREASRDSSAGEDHLQGVINPLDSFMGKWISAQDHDLLLPAGQTLGASSRAGEEALDGLGSRSRDDALSALLEAPVTASFNEAKSPDNPYLEELDSSASQPMKSFLGPGEPVHNPDFPDFSRGISTHGLEPGPLDGSRSVIPDFAQPSDDDKYFKQLKRF